MLDEKLLKELQEYVDENLIALNFSAYSVLLRKGVYKNAQHNELEEFINHTRKPTFSQVLLNLIDKNGASDSHIYKKACIDRRHFSKIRSDPDYRPSKNTVIALAMSLELNKKETAKFLAVAGYTLSKSNTFDLVIQLICLLKMNILGVKQISLLSLQIAKAVFNRQSVCSGGYSRHPM